MAAENYTPQTVEQITADFTQIKQEILQLLDTYPETYTTMSHSKRNRELRIMMLQILKERCDILIDQGDADAKSLRTEISQYHGLVETLVHCRSDDFSMRPFAQIASVAGWFFIRRRMEDGAAWAQKMNVSEIGDFECFSETQLFHLGCYFFEHHRNATERLFALRRLSEIAFKHDAGSIRKPKLTEQDRELALSLLKREIPQPVADEAEVFERYSDDDDFETPEPETYEEIVADYLNAEESRLEKIQNQVNEKDKLLKSVRTLQSEIEKVLADSKKPTLPKVFLPAHIQTTLQLQIDTLAQLVVDIKQEIAQLEAKPSPEKPAEEKFAEAHVKAPEAQGVAATSPDGGEVVKGLDDGDEAKVDVSAPTQVEPAIDEAKHAEVRKSAAEGLAEIEQEFGSFLEDQKSVNDFFESHIHDLPNERTAELCLENLQGVKAFLNSRPFIFEIRKSKPDPKGRSDQYVYVDIYADRESATNGRHVIHIADTLGRHECYDYNDPFAQELFTMLGIPGRPERSNFPAALRVDSKQTYHEETFLNAKRQQVCQWVSDEKPVQKYSNILAFYKAHSDKTYSDEWQREWLHKISAQIEGHSEWKAARDKVRGMFAEEYPDDWRKHADLVQDVTHVSPESAFFIGERYLSQHDAASKLRGMQFLHHAAGSKTAAGKAARDRLSRQLLSQQYLGLEEKNDGASATASSEEEIEKEIKGFFNQIDQPYAEYCSALKARAATKFDAVMGIVNDLMKKLKKNATEKKKSIQFKIWSYDDPFVEVSMEEKSEESTAEADKKFSVEAKEGLSVERYVENIEKLHSRILQASGDSKSIAEYQEDIKLLGENAVALRSNLTYLPAANEKKLNSAWFVGKSERAAFKADALALCSALAKLDDPLIQLGKEVEKLMAPAPVSAASSAASVPTASALSAGPTALADGDEAKHAAPLPIVSAAPVVPTVDEQFLQAGMLESFASAPPRPQGSSTVSSSSRDVSGGGVVNVSGNSSAFGFASDGSPRGVQPELQPQLQPLPGARVVEPSAQAAVLLT